MGRPGCKIRNKRNAEVDSLSLSLSDYSRVGSDTRVRNVYVKDRSCDVCANRCCGSPPQPFPCLLLIEALTGRRQFVPIDRQLTSVPETEMYETSLGSRYVTYARIKRDANKLLADRSTSSFRIGKLNSPPPTIVLELLPV